MCDSKKVSLSDLILAAICYLQEKNWVSACEIAQYVADKRGCKVEQIEGMIRIILCKAKNSEILCEKKGMYRIMDRYDDPPQNQDNIQNVTISDDDDEDDDEENANKGPNPCACLKLSKDQLDDDDEDDGRCPIKKKRKTCG